MSLSINCRFGFVWILALVLVACDEEEKGSGGGSQGTLPVQTTLGDLPGGNRKLVGEQLAETRVPSARRLGEVLVAQAAGMTRFQDPKVRLNEKLRRVTAEAQYFIGEKYRWDTSMKVVIQWFGRKVMGTEKLGFGMYKPRKIEISSFPALARDPDPSENDKDSAVRMLVAPQLIVSVETEHYDVDAIVKLLSSLDFKGLAGQVEDESIFTPSKDDLILAGMLSVEELKGLLPAEIQGAKATNHQTREDDRGYAYFRQAYAIYGALGRITLIDAGAKERAAERYAFGTFATDNVRGYEKAGMEVKTERISVDGAEVLILLIGRPGKLDKQATVIWRAHAGRFVINGQTNWMASRGEPGLFPDAVSQVKATLVGLGAEALSER